MANQLIIESFLSTQPLLAVLIDKPLAPHRISGGQNPPKPRLFLCTTLISIPTSAFLRSSEIMSQAEGAPARGTVAHLLPQTYKRLVAEWLEEDTPSFDYGGFVVGEEISEAKLLGKSPVCTCIC
jgi:hypothetical protein